MDLKGKVAFVTGGSGDIGGAIARALATAGADVAISYVGQLEAAAATVDALRAAGRRSLAVQLDQRDPVAIAACSRQRREGVGAGGYPGQQRRVEYRYSVHRPRHADGRYLGPCPGNESAGAVLAGESMRPAPARAWGRPDREYRLAGRTCTRRVAASPTRRARQG